MEFPNTDVATPHLFSKVVFQPVLVLRCIFAIESKYLQCFEHEHLTRICILNLLFSFFRCDVVFVVRISLNILRVVQTAVVCVIAGTEPMRVLGQNLKLPVDLVSLESEKSSMPLLTEVLLISPQIAP